MKLYLQRHVKSTPGARNDATRNLTQQGIADAHAMAEFMRRQVGSVEAVITSPYVRSVDTALIMAETLGCQKVPQISFLEPDTDPGQAWDAVLATAGNAEDVLVVTHHPLVNALLEQMCGAKTDDVHWHHGAVAHVEDGMIRWFVTPPIAERDEALVEAAVAVTDAYCAEVTAHESAKRESLRHPKHEAQLAPLRAAAKPILARCFKRQSRRLLRAIDAHLRHVAANNPNLREADSEAKDAVSYALPGGYQLPIALGSGMKVDYSKALQAALTAGYDTLGTEHETETEIGADAVEQYLRDHSLEKLTGQINKTSVDRLRNALADAYESGEDYTGLVDTIKEEFADFADTRAELIAQTEMNNAYNQGRKQLGLDLGFNEKSWSADGPAPCPECIGNVLEGWIGMDEAFPSGDFEPVAHPGCFCSLDVRLNPRANQE